jgi:DNA-binding winged helix-turn-helix (wHTH) protein
MRVRFGEFVVDDATRQVLRAGVPVHLSPRAFDLLATLIRERPRALSKADLHAQLWPKTFVSDASLAMLVAEVRAALGESARQSSAIRTLHRHGYAFQADAQDATLPAPAAAGMQPAAGEAAMGFWLVTEGRQIALAPGENVVGRDPKARVWLDSPSVSRRHASLRVEGGQVTLVDLDSKNGTFVRDERIAVPIALADGDDLRFGSVGVTFRAWAAEPTRTEGDAV